MKSQECWNRVYKPDLDPALFAEALSQNTQAWGLTEPELEKLLKFGSHKKPEKAGIDLLPFTISDDIWWDKKPDPNAPVETLQGMGKKRKCKEPEGLAEPEQLDDITERFMRHVDEHRSIFTIVRKQSEMHSVVEQHWI